MMSLVKEEGEIMRRHAILVVILLLAFNPPKIVSGKSGLETYGDIGRYAIPGVAVLVSLGREEGPDKEGLIQLGVSGIVTEGIVRVLKPTINRERPNGKNHSFPSGHTAKAFSGASYLHYRYGWQYGAPAYLAASVVGYSRIEANKHFVTDVIAGAAIANSVAFLFVDSIDEDVVIIPVFNTKKPNFGILAQFKF